MKSLRLRGDVWRCLGKKQAPDRLTRRLQTQHMKPDRAQPFRFYLQFSPADEAKPDCPGTVSEEVKMMLLSPASRKRQLHPQS